MSQETPLASDQDHNQSTSRTVAELAKALAKAQGEFPQIEKDREVEVEMRNGGSYSYSYATLPAILAAVKKPLADNGLSLSQYTVLEDNGRVTMVSRILHSSGEWSEAEWPLARAGSIQDQGSELTYVRRYLATMQLGIAADDDDDGAKAKDAYEPNKPRSAPKASGGGPTPKPNAPAQPKAGPAPGQPKPAPVVTPATAAAAPKPIDPAVVTRKQIGAEIVTLGTQLNQTKEQLMEWMADHAKCAPDKMTTAQMQSFLDVLKVEIAQAPQPGDFQ